MITKIEAKVKAKELISNNLETTYQRLYEQNAESEEYTEEEENLIIEYIRKYNNTIRKAINL
jgi:iron-sulfur cluster repair protein YtfE (RIC family)